MYTSNENILTNSFSPHGWMTPVTDMFKKLVEKCVFKVVEISCDKFYWPGKPVLSIHPLHSRPHWEHPPQGQSEQQSVPVFPFALLFFTNYLFRKGCDTVY